MGATITYLDHSGFAVAQDGHMMIFDYYNDNAERRDLAHGVITRAELGPYGRVSVFVSHGHGDHFNPAIFGWADSVKAEYFLSDDIGSEHPGFRLRPGEALEREGMMIWAYGSTDLGASFLVETGGLRIFHAGDLNWWHWREESTPMEIAQSETDFKREMEPIIAEAKKAPFDIAFFPVDPRQKSFYDAGANYFVLSVKPKVFVPMHTMNQPELVNDYARRTQQRGTLIVPMTARGQQYIIQEE